MPRPASGRDRRSHSIWRARTPARPGASWRAAARARPTGRASAAPSRRAPRRATRRRGAGPDTARRRRGVSGRAPARPSPAPRAGVAERAQHVVVGAIVEPERPERLQRRRPHLGVAWLDHASSSSAALGRAGEADQLGDDGEIVGMGAGVRDQRVRDARPELADRLDDAGALVARRVRQRAQQRRHAAGIAEMAERLDRRGAHLLVRIVEAARAAAAGRPRRGPARARAPLRPAATTRARRAPSSSDRSGRGRAAAARAASTGEPDATRSGLIRSAPICGRCRAGAGFSRAIAASRSAGAGAASTASTSGW